MSSGKWEQEMGTDLFYYTGFPIRSVLFSPKPLHDFYFPAGDALDAFFMYSMKKARKTNMNSATTPARRTICFFLGLTGCSETSDSWMTFILLINPLFAFKAVIFTFAVSISFSKVSISCCASFFSFSLKS